MRRVSITARGAHDAAQTDQVEVALIRITHPDLSAPIYISTDPTEQLSLEPLVYGTRSTWTSGDGEAIEWLYAATQAILPDDQEDAPAKATLALQVVTEDMAAPLRQTTTRATVDMAVVMASQPDVVEVEYRGLSLTMAEGDATEIRLTLSRDPITSEPYPGSRMTRAVFPGLHR